MVLNSKRLQARPAWERKVGLAVVDRVAPSVRRSVAGCGRGGARPCPTCLFLLGPLTVTGDEGGKILHHRSTFFYYGATGRVVTAGREIQGSRLGPLQPLRPRTSGLCWDRWGPLGPGVICISCCREGLPGTSSNARPPRPRTGPGTWPSPVENAGSSHQWWHCREGSLPGGCVVVWIALGRDPPINIPRRNRHPQSMSESRP